MYLQYSSGKKIEGVALNQTGNTMRVALRGHADVVELVQIQGCWISEDFEPVRIQPSWAASGQKGNISEKDLVCPGELVQQLVELLNHSPEVPAAPVSCHSFFPADHHSWTTLVM